MNKTKIEWADYTWNPIKGLCPEACWYCYARRMYHRFRLDNFYEHLEFHVTRGEIDKMGRLSPSRIFICSTMEMFHPQVEAPWRDKIFQTIEMFPQHTFIILTKRPELIDRPMPDNVWLGVSVTGASTWEIYRTAALGRAKARIKFISFEPILGAPWLLSAMPLRANWIIAGRLTGHGKKRDPHHSTIEAIVEYGRVNGIPVFLKNNLKDIWPGPLIQEYPQ